MQPSTSRPDGLTVRARRTIAVLTARIVRRGSRLVGHGGTSLPGMLARRIDPSIVSVLAAELGPIVFVVGTNGKTTTARVASRILRRESGRSPLANRSGANLRQGLASSLVAESDLRGHLRRPGGPAVFEVDELALAGLLRDVTPTAIVVLNLFRDQLDRYGEIDTIVDRWRVALRSLPASTVLVSCADDARIEDIVAGSGMRAIRFGVAAAAIAQDGLPAGAASIAGLGSSPADPIACRVCDEPLDFAWRTIGHLGGWSCRHGHVSRQAPDIEVAFDQPGTGGSTRLVFHTAVGTASATVRLSGIAAAYDVAAAVAVAGVVGISTDRAIRAVDGATPAFGRLEEARVRGRRVVLALVKNPASLTESALVAASLDPDGLLLGLSDQPADGRDVSWIWDVDFGILRRIPLVGLTGTRLDDLAIRLKYAVGFRGHPTRIVTRSPIAADALDRMIGAIRPGGTLVVLATYTSLLALRATLEGRGMVPAMPG